MKFNHNALVVVSDSLTPGLPAAQALKALETAVIERGFNVQLAANPKAGLTYIQQSPHYSFIALLWDTRNPAIVSESQQLIQQIRERNDTVPIFLLSEEETVNGIPVSILREINEYVYLYS